MSHTVTVTPKYGAIELKAVARKYMSIGLAVGSVMVTSVVGTYHLAVWLTEEEEPEHTVRILKYTDLGPPPSLNNASAPSVAVSSQVVKPSIGTPVPVPDAEVSPEATIASMEELSKASAPVIDAGGGAAGTNIEQDLVIDEEPPDFVPYEKEPTVVKRVEPKYPELAQRASIEGTVIVKVWVDKEGKVRKALIQKSDSPIFEEPAKEAAMQWIFTPALMQKGPVSVWVAIPFRFKMNTK
jgi:periplasmic protein TonB